MQLGGGKKRKKELTNISRSVIYEFYTRQNKRDAAEAPQREEKLLS